jgi:hypothetical protein
VIHGSRRALLVIGFLVAPILPAHAQRRDTTAARPTGARPAAVRPAAISPGVSADSLRPPLSPGRALVYSMILPGYGQAVLGRHKAATGFLLAEAISLAMIRESAADVHEARRTANDTIVVSYVNANGAAALTTDSSRFNSAYVRTRHAHVEDWTALLIANHLIAGADAFVAANLWDVPVRVGLRTLSSGATALAFTIGAGTRP